MWLVNLPVLRVSEIKKVDMYEAKINDEAIAQSKFDTAKRSYYATEFDGDDEYKGVVLHPNSIEVKTFSRRIVNEIANEDLEFKPTALGEIIKLWVSEV
jgi:hypothetical protein